MLDKIKGPVLKSRDEIQTMDRANRIVLEILEMMRAMVKPGATTAQLNAMAEEVRVDPDARRRRKGHASRSPEPWP